MSIRYIFLILERALFIGGCIMSALPLRASSAHIPDSVSANYIHRIGLDAVPSYIYQTRPFLRGNNSGHKAIRHSLGMHLKYSFQFASHTRWGSLYPHTSQGLGISFDTFFRSRELGKPFTVYVFQNSRIFRFTPSLSLDYEWNFGVSTGWKRHDEDENQENDVIGSSVNAHLYLAFLLNWRMSEHWNILAGIGGSHFSNGNTRLPNWGLNTVGIHLGVVRTINTLQDQSEKTDAFVPFTFTPHWSYDLVVYGTSRQKKIHKTDDYDAFIAKGHFGVFGLNFSPMYHFNRYFRGGFSLDVQYDESANLKDYMLNDPAEVDVVQFARPPLNKQLGIGLSLRGELVMPIFSLNVGLGKNMLGRGSDLKRLYQVFGLKTHLNKHIFLNIGYQLYKFKEPNGLMLGMGYTFNAR